MTIVANVCTKDPPETDGSNQRIVTYTYTFHNGEVFVVSKRVDVDFDADQECDDLIPEIETKMRDQEISSLVEQYGHREASDDPLDVVPVHPETDTEFIRVRRFRRKLTRRLVRFRDIQVVRRVLYPLWYWAKFIQGYDANQVADYLNVTVGQVAAFDSRMQAYDDNLTFIDGDASLDWGD